MTFFAFSLLIGVVGRLIPHVANFTPVGAIILYYGNKKGYKSAILLGLLIMVISDTLLGFNFASPFVYVGFCTYALFSPLLRKKFGIVVSPILSSLTFFLVSNFGVWLGPWYTHNTKGFLECFTLAIPFYRNMLIGDMVFIVAIYTVAKLFSREKTKSSQSKLEGIWQKLSGQKILMKK